MGQEDDIPMPVALPVLDLGCGPAKFAGAIGMDRHQFPFVDIVRDVLRGIPFNDSHFSAVHAKHFLEHFAGDDLIFVVEEMWRVTIPGGRLMVTVPDATSPNRYRDPTHLTRDWSADSFMFWEVNDNGQYAIFRGPDYRIRAQLRCLSTAVNANLDRMYDLEVVK
jgi:SAM-dependent methyltransferase